MVDYMNSNWRCTGFLNMIFAFFWSNVLFSVTVVAMIDGR
jgi:hypothetical protein